MYLKQHESEVGTEKLRAAFTYALNQEKYLRVFLTDGDVPMDNNASERAIRGFCVGKKNWQMIDTINVRNHPRLFTALQKLQKRIT